MIYYKYALYYKYIKSKIMEIDQPSIDGCYKIENNIVTDCKGDPADYNEISNVTEFLQRLRTGIMVGTVSLFARNKKEQFEKKESGRDATTLEQEEEVITDSNVNENSEIRDNEFSLPNFNEELLGREKQNQIKKTEQQKYISKKNIPDHLTEREVKNLGKAGFLNDDNVGHEEAIFREMHPSHLTQPVFRKQTKHNNWDNVNSFEVPRYPVYAYGESSTPSGKEGSLYEARTSGLIDKYWND